MVAILPEGTQAKVITQGNMNIEGHTCRSGASQCWAKQLQLVISLAVAFVQAKKEVWTAMQRTNLHLLPRKTHKVHRMRQRNAFPPNFIHSLDASHMMMTALACRDHGETPPLLENTAKVPALPL